MLNNNNNYYYNYYYYYYVTLGLNLQINSQADIKVDSKLGRELHSNVTHTVLIHAVSLRITTLPSTVYRFPFDSSYGNLEIKNDCLWMV